MQVSFEENLVSMDTLYVLIKIIDSKLPLALAHNIFMLMNIDCGR